MTNQNTFIPNNAYLVSTDIVSPSDAAPAPKADKIDIDGRLEALVMRRRQWEAGSYAQSNAELYALLADCLDLYLLFRKQPDLCKGLNDLLKQKSIACNAGTSLPLKIVRAAFVEPGMEEKVANRAYGYARVIKVAADRDLTGKDLAKFIVDHHGIDEIRRTDKDGRTKAQVDRQFEESADHALAAAPGIAKVAMTEKLKPADGERFTVALLRQDSDGMASVVFAINNATLVKAALRHAGKAIVDDAQRQVSESAERERKDLEERNRQAAKAMIDGVTGSFSVKVAA